MHIIHTVEALRARLKLVGEVAFVPTMGNLHAGHIALVTQAKALAPYVVVSIFVNPLQFGANEDLGSYPRTLDADCEKLKVAGADVVFAPNVAEMYPNFDGKRLHQTMTIKPPPIADQLCGASRPGHFEGVATVVMKLFNIVQPQIAVFGKKDYQQLFIIQDMVKQFNLPIQIVAGETVREPSGLALSSRNGYLTETQRAEAPRLYAVLSELVANLQAGQRDCLQLEQQATRTLTQRGWQVEYVRICCAVTLLSAQTQDKDLVVLAAAKLGNTRLIDNLSFSP